MKPLTDIDEAHLRALAERNPAAREVFREVDALRAKLAEAERERDEAQRERDIAVMVQKHGTPDDPSGVRNAMQITALRRVNALLAAECRAERDYEAQTTPLAEWGGGPCADPSKCDEPEFCAMLKRLVDARAAVDAAGLLREGE